MARISVLRLGLAFGGVVGLLHLLWALLVMVQAAQPVLDFVLWTHFIQPVLKVDEFAPATAVILVTVTGGVGFLAGCVLATIWNALHRPHAENV